MSAVDYTLHEAAAIPLRSLFNGSAQIAAMTSASLHLFGLKDLGRQFDALEEMFRRATKTYDKPAFNLSSVAIGSEDVRVTEEIALSKPYGDLLHFRRDTDRQDPKVLLVAPMSGHYATLLRGTVQALLPHHDVYITDWRNVRDVPLSAGPFGLDEYETYVEDFIDHLGPDTHVVAVCQPTVPVLAAAALKAARGDAVQPLSMTLMGGPIDTRAAPTEVTRFGQSRSIEWFRDHVVTRVPLGHLGAGQPVHAGHNQLMGFIWMNPDKHVRSHYDMFDHLCRGNEESAAKIREFYDEYMAVMDIHGQFYLDTVQKVFMEHQLPKGELRINNQLVNPSSIKRPALFTVEGEKDDISAPGQTEAAHKLCNNILPDKHFHYIQPGSGHYGIFEGRRWREEICPRIAGFIRQTAGDNGLKYSEIPSNTRVIPPNLWQKTEPFPSPAPALQK